MKNSLMSCNIEKYIPIMLPILLVFSWVFFQNRKILGPFLLWGFKQACFLYLMQGVSTAGKKKKKDMLVNLHLIFWKTCSQVTNWCKSPVRILIWTGAMWFRVTWSGLYNSFQSETCPFLTKVRPLAITWQPSPTHTASCGNQNCCTWQHLYPFQWEHKESFEMLQDLHKHYEPKYSRFLRKLMLFHYSVQ